MAVTSGFNWPQTDLGRRLTQVEKLTWFGNNNNNNNNNNF